MLAPGAKSPPPLLDGGVGCCSSVAGCLERQGEGLSANNAGIVGGAGGGDGEGETGTTPETQ